MDSPGGLSLSYFNFCVQIQYDNNIQTTYLKIFNSCLTVVVTAVDLLMSVGQLIFCCFGYLIQIYKVLNFKK